MRKLLFVTPALALAIVCCSSSVTKTPECFVDSDCSTGQCLSGECKPLSCKSNGDCRGGMICQDSSCQVVASCNSDGDCNGWYCLAGNCVQCRKDEECAEGLKCLFGTCRTACAEDRDCPQAVSMCDPAFGVCVNCYDDSHCGNDKPRCDTYRGVCVECLSSLDCTQPEVCQNQTCIQLGCVQDSDCAAPTPHCDTQSGQCFECVLAEHCPEGQVCADHRCQTQQTGCNSVDECSYPTPFCSPEHKCVECLENSHCSSGYHCHDYFCLPGECNDNDDCSEDKPLCNTQVDPSRCVQCLSDNDCLTTSDHYCLLPEGRCVQCFRNAHCPSDAVCNKEFHCQSGFTDCMPCVSDRCLSGAVCFKFSSPEGTIVDRGCVRTCYDQSDCNRGFYCQPAQEGGGVSVCLPAYDKTSGTCEAIRDIGVNCLSDSECGVPGLNDAVCMGVLQKKACTIPCGQDSHCPDPYICWANPQDPGSRKVCAPRLP